jgi:hypothetical protein
LRKFRYENNEIEYIPPPVIRFLSRNKNITHLEVYNDGQNIHNHSIQSSIGTSISNIMNKKLKRNDAIIINEILNDNIITLKTKELLIEYCNYYDYHSCLLITFKELLLYVWELIQENEYKDAIKSILNTEMQDIECKCFTGRITRLLNCLNGFNDLIEIKISDNQQIANVIIIIKEQLELKNDYTIENHKRLATEELKERGYDETIIEAWISQIDY